MYHPQLVVSKFFKTQTVAISNYREMNKKPVRDNDLSGILDLEDYKLLKPTLETF